MKVGKTIVPQQRAFFRDVPKAPKVAGSGTVSAEQVKTITRQTAQLLGIPEELFPTISWTDEAYFTLHPMVQGYMQSNGHMGLNPGVSSDHIAIVIQHELGHHLRNLQIYSLPPKKRLLFATQAIHQLILNPDYDYLLEDYGLTDKEYKAIPKKRPPSVLGKLNASERYELATLLTNAYEIEAGSQSIFLRANPALQNKTGLNLDDWHAFYIRLQQTLQLLMNPLLGKKADAFHTQLQKTPLKQELPKVMGQIIQDHFETNLLTKRSSRFKSLKGTSEIYLGYRFSPEEITAAIAEDTLAREYLGRALVVARNQHDKAVILEAQHHPEHRYRLLQQSGPVFTQAMEKGTFEALELHQQEIEKPDGELVLYQTSNLTEKDKIRQRILFRLHMLDVSKQSQLKLLIRARKGLKKTESRSYASKRPSPKKQAQREMYHSTYIIAKSKLHEVFKDMRKLTSRLRLFRLLDKVTPDTP